jgi:hypothetical protein
MDHGISVRIEVDNKLFFKINVNKDDIDLKNLSGYVSEGVGRSLKEQAVGAY